MTAYSGNDPTTDIKTEEISNRSYVNNDETYDNLTGVALTYQGGSVCPSSGEPRTFTINILCKPGLQGAYEPQTFGDECNPEVNLVS